MQDKITGLQELYDNNQKMLQIGRKINEMSNRYFQNNDKKQLNAQFQKWITIEKVNYSKKLEESQTEKIKSVKSTVKKNSKAKKKTEKEILKFQAKNLEKPSKRDLRILKKQQAITDKLKKEKLAKIEREVLVDVNKVRQKKQVIANNEAKLKANYIFKVGDKVRLENSRANGTIEKIEKKWIFVNFGNMMSKVSVEKLELID